MIIIIKTVINISNPFYTINIPYYNRLYRQPCRLSNFTLKGTIIKDPNRKLPEALLLFFVIFFPRNTGEYSLYSMEEIGYSLFWRLPAAILILLLLAPGREKLLSFRPKRDLLTLAVTLPLLCITGFLVSLAASVTGFLPPPAMEPPETGAGWLAAISLSVSIGFLEEAFFRLYLPLRIIEMKQDQTGRTAAIAHIVSGVIFALCHAYEGPWGIANALLAAFILSAAYIKSASFSGIVLAHGFYNVLVFLSTAIFRE